jgi:biofilm PGA synthesis N-glycosyltransferase PgaC
MRFLIGLLTAMVVFVGVLNLLRLSFFMIGSDIYGLIHHLRRKTRHNYQPRVSVVIPAYNEAQSILGCVSSVLRSDYPRNKLEVIVVNDGSTDDTAAVLTQFLSHHPGGNVRLITQANSGKAHALNNGLRNWATGELAMCLDADSELRQDSVRKAAAYFQDGNVMAMAANVKIKRRPGILNLVQAFEYTVSYQMKKTLTVCNMEYIVGGVGSMFRRSFLRQIEFYDTNTVTEDIDLTMKILHCGNKEHRVIYGADVVAYTQHALTMQDLVKQRYRWKWGRYQTFLKNKDMFFSRDRKFTRALTWFYLPFALFSDLALFFEPFVVLFVWAIIVYFRDLQSFLTMVGVTSFYLGINVLADDGFSMTDKTKLISLVPIIYFLFYILSMVEYVALVRSWVKLHDLRRSLDRVQNRWQPITRPGL